MQRSLRMLATHNMGFNGKAHWTAGEGGGLREQQHGAAQPRSRQEVGHSE